MHTIKKRPSQVLLTWSLLILSFFILIHVVATLASNYQSSELFLVIMDALSKFFLPVGLILLYIVLFFHKRFLTFTTKWMLLFVGGSSVLITSVLASMGDASTLLFPALEAGGLYAPLMFLAGSCYLMYFYKRPLFWILTAALFIFVASGISSLIFTTSTIFLSCVIGLSLGVLCFILQYTLGFFSLVTKKISKEIEYRRQIAHFIVGSTLALLLHYNILDLTSMIVITIIGAVCVILVKRGKLSLLRRVLKIFEREHHMKRFPGRGVFYMFIGSIIVLSLFDKTTALASIMILSVGASITNIVGKDLGSIPFPYNKKKNIEGPLVGAVIAGFFASIYVPFDAAIIASLIALFVESLPLHWKGFEIDDNITIPLAAGLTLAFLF